MNKAQVTIEFMFSLLFYLLFLSILLSAIHNYNLILKENSQELSSLVEIEEKARIFDFYYSSDSHFSMDMGEKEYHFNNNLIYSEESSAAVETLYSEEGLDGEAT